MFLMLFATIGWQQVGAQSFIFGGITYYVNANSPTTVRVGHQSQAATGNIVIPEQVTYNNGSYAVTSIGNDAFYNCPGLTSVTIPNSVTSIGVTAIAVCQNLTSITIPNSVITIGYGAFSYCYALKSVTIPNSVTSISDYAFYNCHNLSSVIIPNSVTSIGMGAFQYCFSLTSVTVPNSVTSIGNYAFAACPLTTVSIPSLVTNIGKAAFYGCKLLTTITIPNSVASIGDSAFADCTGLTSVTVHWSTLLAINTTVFQGVNRPGVVLNVPIDAASIYEATSVWTDFVINGPLGVTPFSATITFNLIAYPNPSNYVFNFKINGAIDETVSLTVFDMMGRQIEKKVVNMNELKNICFGQDYSSGVYNIIAAQGMNTKSVRLIKK